MKKTLTAALAILAVVALCLPAPAAVGNRDNSVTINGAVTNTGTTLIRGIIEAVAVRAPASSTGAVTLVTAEGVTAYSATVGNTAATAAWTLVPVRAAVATVGGLAWTPGGATNYVDKIATAGTATWSVINAAAQTNTYLLRAIYSY